MNRLGLKLIQKYYKSADGADISSDSHKTKIDNFLQDTNGLTEEVIKQHSDWLLKTKKEMKISHKKYKAPMSVLIIIAMIPLVVNILRLVSAFSQVFILKRYQSKSLKLIFNQETSKIYVDQRGLHKSDGWGAIGPRSSKTKISGSCIYSSSNKRVTVSK